MRIVALFVMPNLIYSEVEQINAPFMLPSIFFRLLFIPHILLILSSIYLSICSVNHLCIWLSIYHLLIYSFIHLSIYLSFFISTQDHIIFKNSIVTSYLTLCTYCRGTCTYVQYFFNSCYHQQFT